MSERDPVRLRDAATAIARDAGAIVRAGYGRIHAPERKGRIDLVTDYDRRSEALIVEALRRRFPDHALLAEESGAHAAANSSSRTGSNTTPAASAPSTSAAIETAKNG